MHFTWHERKRQTTLKERGLDFAEAEQVFAGPTFTDEIHLISMRKADRDEQRLFFSNLG
jgi:uncharacterized DUF497 family protein